MTITTDNVAEAYQQYMQGKGNELDYTADISSSIKMPMALEAIEILEAKTTFTEKAEFVRKLLMGTTVTIKLYGRTIANFVVNEGFQWFAVPEFHTEPSALRFLVGAVYGLFLKNCVPHLTDSQEQVRKEILAQREKEQEAQTPQA